MRLERSVLVSTAASASPSVIAGSASERSPLTGSSSGIGVAGDGQPSERHAEQEDQEQGDEEVRHADPEEGERRARAVRRGVPSRRREHAEREGHQERDQHRQERQLQAGPQAARHVLDDRLPVPDRAPEVALKEPAHPSDVLHVDRLIEAELPAELRLHAGVHGLGHHRVDRIAGREVDQEEHAGRDEHEDRDHGDQAAQQKPAHGRGSSGARHARAHPVTVTDPVYFSQTLLNRIIPSGMGS